MRRIETAFVALWALLCAATLPAQADPCGMVPPIQVGPIQPSQEPMLRRVGEQKTFVFYKDGIETFVIRPGFRGRVDNFGMLIPFPSPPAIRKVPDNIFAHVAAAIDPPEVIEYVGRDWYGRTTVDSPVAELSLRADKATPRNSVRVLREEAVGMYQVAVLEAGSAKALARWMDRNGYRYPKGMDAACEDYVKEGWCFVAVKTQVGAKSTVDPKPGMRDVKPALPGGAFEGNVQAMGFRFRTDELVVPMRLSAFNEGELRNVVYVLTDGPCKIRNIPDAQVVRQISGEELYRNLTKPLPLRIIGGGFDDIPSSRLKTLAARRNPAPHNGLARELFASDLLAVSHDRLANAFEEREKVLLRIGERLTLRGPDLDALHHEVLEKEREKAIGKALDGIKGMTLSVIDGDFPRDVLANENLRFEAFSMAKAKNTAAVYDAKRRRPAPKLGGTLISGPGTRPNNWTGVAVILGIVAVLAGLAFLARRVSRKAAVLLVAAGALAVATTAGAEDKSEGLTQKARQVAESNPEAFVELMAAQGSKAVAPLLNEVRDGTDIAIRGWCVVCLAEIGGKEADGGLKEIQYGDYPRLVQTWAAAGRVRLSTTFKELVALSRDAARFPGLSRALGKKMIALASGAEGAASAEELIDITIRMPATHNVLMPAILKAEPKSLVAAMIRGKGNQVRRTAAAYLASAARGANARKAAAAVADALTFEPKAERAPWSGGALFLPALNWPTKEAKRLTGSLVSWMLFAQKNGQRPVMRQILNNLASVRLGAASKLVINGAASPERVLSAWRRVVGAEKVRALLQEQGLQDADAYRDLIR